MIKQKKIILKKTIQQSYDVNVLCRNNLKKLFNGSFEFLNLILPYSSLKNIFLITTSDDNIQSYNVKFKKIFFSKDLLNQEQYKVLKKKFIKRGLVFVKNSIYNNSKYKNFILKFSKRFKKIIFLSTNEISKIINGMRFVILHKNGTLYCSFSNNSRIKLIQQDLNDFIKQLKDVFLKRFKQRIKIKKLYISTTQGSSDRII